MKKRGYCQAGGGPKEGAATATLWPSQQTGPHSQTWGRDHSLDKALREAKEAHQWALETAHMLELNIKRLNKEAYGTKHQWPCRCSCPWGRSMVRHVHSLDWPKPERHITFCKSGEGTPSDKSPERTQRALDQRAAGGRQLRPSVHPEARVGACLGGAHNWPEHQGWVGLHARATDKELWSVAGMVSLPVGYTPLVGGADHHTRGRRYKEVGPEDLCTFQHPSSHMWGPQKPGLHCTPCTQVP